MQVANGRANNRPTDFLVMELTGGRDNYDHDYGQTPQGEYLSSRLYLADSDGTVFNPFITMLGMPLSLSMSDFEIGSFDLSAKNNTGDSLWAVRGEFTGIRNDALVASISEPVTLALLVLGFVGIGYSRMRLGRT